ncbi:MAG: tRNA pseudouridine(38-40) synthase TruA [Planctomycetota bacterium]
MARRIKLTLEYDGSAFNGWQVQSSAPAGEADSSAARTVQGEVERALRIVTGQSIRIAGASRTDTGAHALGQVASFLLPDEVEVPTARLCIALNAKLDRDVAARLAQEMPLAFHARRDAVGKVYSYSIISGHCRPALWRRTHWHVRFAVQSEPMRQAAAALIGVHDFTSFASKLALTQAERAEDGKEPVDTVREIRRLELHEDPDYPGRLVMRIEGSGFLYQMVRTIAGSLVDVGRGYRPPDWLGSALAAQDRRAAGPTAPAHGLCLERVLY